METLTSEGIDLKKRGSSYWSLCPLHTENTPSFKVDAVRQFFYCFGCKQYGDVINFVQEYKELSFKDALAYLRIDGNNLPKQNKRENKKNELLRDFKKWCNSYCLNLIDMYRNLQEAKIRVKSIAIIELLSPYYHQENHWLEQIDILDGDDEEAKFNLYREVVYGR